MSVFTLFDQLNVKSKKLIIERQGTTPTNINNQPNYRLNLEGTRNWKLGTAKILKPFKKSIQQKTSLCVETNIEPENSKNTRQFKL